MDEKKMQKFVGVRFRPTGKIYHFDPGELSLAPEMEVIVDTDRGPGYGFVASEVRQVPAEMAPETLKKVLRIATDADRKIREENRVLERRAMDTWEERVQKHSLEMVLVDVEYTFDRSKLLFYFTAEGRVDFREFVKELAGIFKTRIELRQIGVRDEAKKVGGLGICGRPFCCASFLPDFEQVSIKMAKEQNLSLNSAKISGTCGRLMCCLRYENDAYVEEAKLTPKVDWVVDTADGRGVVTEANVLKGTVRVRLDDDPERAPQLYHRDDVTVFSNKKRPKNQPPKAVAESEEAPEPKKKQKTKEEKTSEKKKQPLVKKPPQPKEQTPKGEEGITAVQEGAPKKKRPRRRRRRPSHAKDSAPKTEESLRPIQ